MSGLRIVGGELTLPTQIITDPFVASNAAIGTEKLKHSYKPSTTFNSAIGDAPATREEIVMVATSAGTIKGFHAMLNVTGSSTDIDFDLKLNGVTVLSSVVNITNTDADGLVKDGVLSTTAFTIDDIFSISMAVTTNTGASGSFAWIDIEEDNAPS